MLTEPILWLETADGLVEGTLPDALGRLCAGSLVGFEGLAAHQRHGWFRSLYQTAALALERGGEAGAAEDDAAWARLADPCGWRGRLAALAGEHGETAWSLCVDDVTQPAFMQPPIEAGGLGRHKQVGRTPDEIDVLVTAKGHDVKAARAGAGEARHWAYALATLQTQQGYSGRGNFGIARMNGGFGSRPLFELTPSPDLPTRFRRGVRAALRAREAALGLDPPMFDPSGLALLWLVPWDREESLPLRRLDPLFVEICRRVRLARAADGRITAWGRPSEVPRVAAPKELKGNLGDAWTPTAAKDGAALTVGGNGFDYRLLQRLLASPELDRPSAMRPRAGETAKTMWLHAAVLVRGQGKTEGLHERWLPVEGAVLRGLAQRKAPLEIGQLGERMITEADAARKALRHAVLAFLQGGPDDLDFEDDNARDVGVLLDQRIDAFFLRNLFDRADAEGDAGRRDAAATAWRAALCDAAEELFQQAAARLSPPRCRVERAHAMGELILRRALLRSGLIERRDAPAGTPTESLEGSR